MNKCQLCKGKLTHHLGTNIIRDTIIDCYFSICSKCGVKQANKSQVSVNNRIMRGIK